MPIGSTLTLWIASVGTVLWLAGCAVMLRIKCDNGLACMAPNEWGDFTAGAFSTLAFIWLAVAVILQSTELREQRKELALTREEFELQRDVMKEQANEARRQANLLSAQTDILREENSDRRTAVLIEQFDSTVEEIRSMLIDTAHIEIHGQSPDFPKGVDIEVYIREAEREIATQKFVSWFDDQFKVPDPTRFELVASPQSARNLRVVARLLEKAIELARDTRTDDRRTWAVVRLKLDEMSSILGSVNLGTDLP